MTLKFAADFLEGFKGRSEPWVGFGGMDGFGNDRGMFVEDRRQGGVVTVD